LYLSTKSFLKLLRRCLWPLYLVAVVFAVEGYAQKPKPVPPATLSGTLLKSDGKPRQYMELQLVPTGSNVIVNDSRLISVSDTRGKFAFNEVPAGMYTLSIKFNDMPTELSPYSTFYYPSTENRRNAEAFEIRSDTLMPGIIFRLPPELVKGRITGRVVWDDDGKPVGGA
jgi:hypothetical protein